MIVQFSENRQGTEFLEEETGIVIAAKDSTMGTRVPIYNSRWVPWFPSVHVILQNIFLKERKIGYWDFARVRSVGRDGSGECPSGGL